MGDVIGEILPLALGVAISPMPIMAVILMLLAPRAGAAATGFLIGWIAGIVVAATVITIVAQNIGLTGSGGGSTAGAIIKLVLGALMLVLAVKQWRSRPKPGQQAQSPGWLKATDSVTPGKATGLGFALAAINPKNLMMILAAGIAIGSAALPTGQVVATIAVFTVLASCTVALPVIGYLADRAKATGWLNGLKTWLVANNATVMMVLFAVIGAVLIGKGVGGF